MSKFSSMISNKLADMASKIGGIKGKIAAKVLKNVNFKYVLIFQCAMAFIIVACVALLLDALFGNSNSAAEYKISSPEFQATADPRAMDLYNKYGSYLGFTIAQVDEISTAATDGIKGNHDGYLAYTSKTGWLTQARKYRISDLVKEAYDESGNLKENLSSSNIASLEFYESSKEGKFLNSISVNDNVPMYTHILRSEKYQFNSIKWMAYKHEGGASEVENSGFAYDESLGLMYPTAGNPDIYKFMELVSPYLMSSKIPASYLSQSVYSSQSKTSMGTSLTDIYYQEQLGSTSSVGNFAYQVVKHGQSDIIMNQYNLQSQSVTSSWEEYHDYTCTDTFKIVKEVKTGKYYDASGNYVQGHDEQISVRYYLVPESYIDGTDKHDDSNKGTFHNSRFNDETQKIENKLEDIVSKPSPTISVQYKLASALAFDVYVTNSYEYEVYEDDDVTDLINANYESGITSEELKRVSEGTTGNHYTMEQLQTMGSEDLKNLVDTLSVTASGVKSAGQYTQHKWEDNTRWDIETTVQEYTITSNQYILEYGDTNYITRTWSDTVSADPTNTKKVKLGLNDLVNFNKNTEKAPGIETVQPDDIKSDSASLGYYSSLIEDEETAINTVDLLDSNRTIFKNYMSGANARYKYAGYTRAEYTVSKGNSLVKEEFQDLARNNNDTLPFVYGETFGFDTGAEEPSALSASSSRRLLYDYIHELEGTGPTKEEGGIKYYQIYTINDHRTVGHGLDLETSGKESDLIELANRAGYSITTNAGDWIPAEIVDTITDGEIEKWYSVAEANTSGLNLEEYQKHAMASRAYNAGGFSYLPYQSSPCNGNINFSTAYNTYWNAEIDNKYEELFELYGGSDVTSEQENDIYSRVDYNHGLYTSYMAGPNNGGQLENRRKSEWVLFQTGYYGFNTSLKRFYGGSGGTILECAEYIHKYMEDNNYGYCVLGNPNNSYEECGVLGRSHGLNSTFEKSQTGYPNTCCATFVSWVLQDAGYMTEDDHIKYGCNGAMNLARFLENQKSWIRIDDVSQLEAGDVMVYTYGHVQFYAGDNTVYNAGSGEAIRRDSPYNGGRPTCNYGLRAPN